MSALDHPDDAHLVRRARLDALLADARRPDTQIVAIGEFKQGKSSLINALVNVNICPVDDDIATAVHTAVRYGENKAAYALVKHASDPDGEGQRVAIEFEQIRNYATELGGTDPSLLVKAVEIEVPRKLLGDGVILVDTPGVGGLGSAHAAAGLGALSIADAAMFISDASQEYTRAEMDYLAQAIEMCPSVVCIMTKTDLYPHWREVLEINQGHLARPVRIVGVQEHDDIGLGQSAEAGLACRAIAALGFGHDIGAQPAGDCDRPVGRAVIRDTVWSTQSGMSRSTLAMAPSSLRAGMTTPTREPCLMTCLRQQRAAAPRPRTRPR